MDTSDLSELLSVEAPAEEEEEFSAPPKILIYDIETSPLMVHAWRTWKVDHVIDVVQDFRVLSVAWKWADLEKGATAGGVQCASIPEWSDDMTDDYGVVATIFDLFDEADIVVAHNGKRFDQKKVLARGFLHGLTPPLTYKEVDTLQTCKRTFALTSNRLGDVCDALGLGTKHETGGFDTWRGCMDGDAASWRKMIRYNKQDVSLLERLYFQLLAWDSYAPNLGTVTDRPEVCPKCGSDKGLKSHGWRYAGVTKRRRFRCDNCQGVVAGRRIINTNVHRVS